ncbi:hypothetical protein K9L97_04200 [Candidatus Woesearchaeota archaeon]|nr:hypothetical protein [Candidatus Woesearchaeota archaeon]
MMDDFKALREKNIEFVKRQIKNSVSKDLMIVHAINNIEELERIINVLVGRLREWFANEDPELEDEVSDNEFFVSKVLSFEGTGSLMGGSFDEDDEKAVKALAISIHGLIQTKNFLLVYLEKTMGVVCPNILALAGKTIGAKLIREAGSLKRLALFQSSTVQLLGAEKALFRHLKSGAKSPKYGHIVNHPIIIACSAGDKGKAARMLGDKLSMCARLDYFKGEFKAEEYYSELKERFDKNG